ncbi:hypothetical protein CHUAL_002480 [Chamberlinius hualienensis]
MTFSLRSLVALFAGLSLAWTIVEGQRLIDCFPENGSNQGGCEARGCIWQQESVQGAPYCIFPDGYGYAINGAETATTLGYQLPLQRKPGQISLYGGDIDNIRLSVEFWSENILRIKFDDPANQRYEVPITIYNKPSAKPSATDYSVSYTSTPEFGIYVTRKSTGAVVFDTRVTGFIFSDQFLQTTTLVPSANVYGFGENRHGRFLHDMNYVQWSMFSRDNPPSAGGNLYGVHPFYLNVENDGNANGVFLLNSNALEVAMHPDPSITYRSIGGVLDFYVFLGPTPEDVTRQYHSLIGFAPMPSYWYLGYTLSRYGYTSTDEIRAVTKSMIDNQLPYDVHVTDIDAFDAYLDFTINPNGFSDLAAWTDELHAQGIRYVPIVDCAIGDERVGSYKALDDGLAEDIFIKNPDGTVLEGNVWPGNSYFPDFSHPNAASYWGDQYQYYHDTLGVHYDGSWIDMNEPSSFVDGSTSGCDNGKYDHPPYPTHIYGNEFGIYQKTICMESQQAYGMHYNVHSLYGYSEAKATYAALQRVFPGKRPNIVSRSTYAGSNNYTTHWLGDNNSDYGALHDSIPGILEFNLFGYPVVGADICGFGGSTTLELCIRWTQLGAFYTFTRNHNTLGSPPQDPPSLGPEMVAAAKLVVTERYRLLPYLYTLLHSVHVNGGTVLRSIVHEFPQDANTRSISFHFMWGSALHIAPVVDKGATTVDIYFPYTRWFDYYTGAEVTNTGSTVTVSAPLDGPIPLHIRGGYIIPTQEPSVTTDKSRQNPFGLIVALDSDGNAKGSFFWDDGDTEDTDSLGTYNEFSLSHSGNTLSITVLHNGYNAQTQPLDSIKFYGVSGQPASVTVDGNSFTSGVNYDTNNKVLTLTGLNLSYLTNHVVVLG